MHSPAPLHAARVINPDDSLKAARRFCLILLALAAAAGFARAQSFAPPVNYAVGSGAQAVLLGDFDKDGKLDLVTANAGDASLSVLRGNGDGAFQSAVAYPSGPEPKALGVGDFNRDGVPDLVVADLDANRNYQTFSVLLGNGDGTFRPKVDADLGPRVDRIAVADMNGDGVSDLVASYGDNGSVGVRLGAGDGTLRAAIYYRFNRSARSLVVQDFNHDGNLDVATTTELDSSNAYVFVQLGKGDGTFQQGAYYLAGQGAWYELSAGDFNGDGKIDLATCPPNSSRVSVLLGNGDGTFQPKIDTNNTNSGWLGAADFDGDGRLDLLVLEFNVIYILGGNGDGTFRTARKYGSAGFTSIAFADLNGDGKPDLVASGGSGTASVFINQTDSLAIGGSVTDAGGAPLGGVTLTLAGDTTTTTTSAADGSYSFRGLTRGGNYLLTPSRQNYTFAPSQQAFNSLGSDQSANFVGTLLSYAVSGFVHDSFNIGVGGVTVTLSGGASAVTTTGSDGRYSFPSVPGGGPYTVTPSMPRRVFSPQNSTILSLTGNRTVNFGISLATYSISVSVSDPESKYVMAPKIALSGTVNRIAGGTQDANGFPVFTGLPVGGNYTVTVLQPDLPFSNFLLTPPTSKSVNDLSANQTVSFSAKSLTFPVGRSPGGVAAGDFNGDGRRDVVVANGGDGTITLLLGNGDGTLQPGVSFAAGSRSYRPLAGDFNGDGKLDVAVANLDGADVSVLLSNGDGTFQPAVHYTVGANPLWIESADLNGDGRLDLLCANYSDHSVTVLLGRGDGTFQPGVNYPVGVALTYVTAGDLNGDGKADVIAGNSVLLGNGDGTLRAALNYSGSANPFGARAADFNGDGKLDIAATSVSNGIGIFVGRGDGTFQSAAVYPSSAGPSTVHVADFNRDGTLDIAMSASNSVDVLMGNGDGTFQYYNIYFFGHYNPPMLAVADLNNDGLPDLAFPNGDGSSVGVLLNRMSTAIQFSTTTYTAREGDRQALITVTRSGDTSGESSVDYSTVDDISAVRCDLANGVAYPRCDYATTVDTLRFAPGEARKTFAIPLVDDAHVEGDEKLLIALSNSSGGTLSGARTATLTISDNDTAPGANPVSNSDFFVRQHYLDFLSREPDPEGFNSWRGLLNGCAEPFNSNVSPYNPVTNPSALCDRVNVSANFFLSTEFQLKGGYVFRFYLETLGRLPRYTEMISDMRSVTGQTPAEVFAKRAAFADGWVARADFSSFYNATTNSTYVEALMGRHGLAQITTPAPQNPEGGVKVTLTKADLISQLDAGTLTRAQVARALVESDEASAADFTSAFVTMQYFGYLRRDPDQSGYNDWFNYLTAHPGDFRTMVFGFVNSPEYRLRFGDPSR